MNYNSVGMVIPCLDNMDFAYLDLSIIQNLITVSGPIFASIFVKGGKFLLKHLRPDIGRTIDKS